MANLFRPTYTKTDPETGEQTTRRLRKWYAKFRDADGVLRRVPLCTDKAAAQAMLTDLVRKAERQQAGLIDRAADQLDRAISEHVEEYRHHLTAKARSETHISETVRIINSIANECRWRILADFQGGASELEGYLALRLETGASHRTINADLTAVRSFCRWLLRNKRMTEDPTAGLTKLNEEQDRRRERRALTDDEARRLIEATWRSERVFRGLTGPDRAVLYLVAQRTGLRRGELRSLTKFSFDLSSKPPTVVVAAAHSKRRRRDALPLTKEVAASVAQYLDERQSDGLLWPGSWWRRSAEMLGLDLAEAGIEAVDARGHVFDFHGQRTSFISGLARAGVSPAMAQKLARHSDINLTLGTYTRLEVEELADALNKLPSLKTSPVSGAGDGPSGISDVSRLEYMTQSWPKLPEQIKQAIVALIAATLASTTEEPTHN